MRVFRVLILLALFALSGCLMAAAEWSADGGCVFCYKTGNDAVEMAKIMRDLDNEAAALRRDIELERGDADRKAIQLAEVQQQLRAGPDFQIQQNRMNAAFADGRLDDLSGADAAAIANAGTLAAQAMASAGTLEQQAAQRDALIAATRQLKAELDRRGV